MAHIAMRYLLARVLVNTVFQRIIIKYNSIFVPSYTTGRDGLAYSGPYTLDASHATAGYL